MVEPSPIIDRLPY